MAGHVHTGYKYTWVDDPCKIWLNNQELKETHVKKQTLKLKVEMFHALFCIYCCTVDGCN